MPLHNVALNLSPVIYLVLLCSSRFKSRNVFRTMMEHLFRVYIKQDTGFQLSILWPNWHPCGTWKWPHREHFARSLGYGHSVLSSSWWCIWKSPRNRTSGLIYRDAWMRLKFRGCRDRFSSAHRLTIFKNDPWRKQKRGKWASFSTTELYCVLCIALS